MTRDDVALRLTTSQRSLLAEIEGQAAWYNTALAIDTVPGIHGVWLSYEHRWRGLNTGLRDGVVLLDESADSTRISWAADALAQSYKCDAFTLRIASKGPLTALTSRSTASLGSATVTISPSFVQEVLSLPEYPAQFTSQFSRDSRRNIERTRYRTEERGMRYRWSSEFHCPDMAELEELCRNNMPGAISAARVRSAMCFSRAQCEPFIADLRDSDGTLASVAGGFVEGRLALIMFQINHRAYREIGPSLSIRAFIAERLITSGVRHVAFVGKCSGILRHSCTRVPIIEMLVIPKRAFARLKHLICILAQPRSRIGRLSSVGVQEHSGPKATN
jgi:hypothetical protein